jgi:hypothetical protein
MRSRFPVLDRERVTVTVFQRGFSDAWLAEMADRLAELSERIRLTVERSQQLRDEAERIRNELRNRW